jgi:hypothetical protein
LDDHVLISLELGHLGIFKFLTFISFVGYNVSLLFDVESDLFTNDLLDLELLLEFLDLIPYLVLLPGVESLHTLKLSLDLSLLVASLQLTLSLGLVYGLFQSGSFIAALLSFLGKLVLLLFQVLVDLLDLVVQVSVKNLQLVELSLLLQALVDLVFEIAVLLVFSHFIHQFFGHGGKVVLVALYELLVASHIGIVLELSH